MNDQYDWRNDLWRCVVIDQLRAGHDSTTAIETAGKVLAAHDKNFIGENK